jgi:nucleoside-diphosphate-sugar epimerase
VAELAIVTGATGWLGRRLVSALLDEKSAFREVRCLVHGDPVALPAGAIAQPGDLADPDSLRPLFRGAEGATLFHCAGLIHPRFVRELHRVNVEGTRNLLEAARGVKRLIHVSSSSPFGFSSTPFDEDAPYRPAGAYGLSKQRAEELVFASGVPSVVVRAPWFYGPDGPERQALFFRMIRRGLAPVVSSTIRRSMVYVDNLCGGLLACAAASTPSRAYWIADRRPYTWGEIFATITEVMESEFTTPIRHGNLRIPRPLFAAASLADRVVQGVGLYSAKLHVIAELGGDIACSIERAERELGYAPVIDLREGVRRTLASMRDRGQSW